MYILSCRILHCRVAFTKSVAETSQPLYKNNLCKKYKIVKDMLISLLKNKIVII